MDPSLFFSCEKIEFFFHFDRGNDPFFFLSCMWLVFSAVMVVSVWNFIGSVDIDNDGSWVSTGEKRHKKEKHPSLVSRFCEFSFTVFSVLAIQFIQFHIISFCWLKENMQCSIMPFEHPFKRTLWRHCDLVIQVSYLVSQSLLKSSHWWENKYTQSFVPHITTPYISVNLQFILIVAIVHLQTTWMDIG